MNKLRVCIFTNHFYPENFKVNDIAFELAQRDYSITVITAIPDYPQGKYYKGYSLFHRSREIIKGVRVIRLPIIPRRKGTSINIILNYISYFFSVLLFIYFHSFTFNYDAIFVHLTSPFFIGLPAVFLKKKQRIPLYFWTLDLWPESLSAAGGITSNFILRPQELIVKYVYSNCDRILIGSKGFRKSICEKGNFSDKIVYFPNWAENIDKNNRILDVNNIFPFSSFIQGDFILLFAGNIGKAQNIEALIETAKMTSDIKEIKWVFLGDGRHRPWLQEAIVDNKLEESVFSIGWFPPETMSAFMRRADILLVSLKDEPVFNLTVPQKVQFYMAQEKPILAMLNGDGAELIKEAQCGFCVSAGDYRQCAEKIKEIYSKRDALNILGQNGKKFYNKNFRKEDRINQLECILR